ncbi:MAG: hypothetical protein LBC74_05885, partial [Planctomycetaceae bacterium]|nr:hypothetical protein [Planctomycetaceae bacterium]
MPAQKITISVTINCAVEVLDNSTANNRMLIRTETVGGGTATFPAWFVGLKKLLYQRAGEVNAWNEVTSTIYTEKNSSLNFKV